MGNIYNIDWSLLKCVSAVNARAGCACFHFDLIADL